MQNLKLLDYTKKRLDDMYCKCQYKMSQKF